MDDATTPPVTPELKVVRKKRVFNISWVMLLVLPLFVLAFRYYNDFAAWVTGIDKSQVADLGVDAIQPVFVVSIYVTWFAVLSMLLATLFNRQFRDNAAGGWSRTFLLYCLYFLGACIIAT
jgi:magnesium-transporting ATPase (P-type)